MKMIIIIKNKGLPGRDRARRYQDMVSAQFFRTYLKINKSYNYRHPRAAGGPLEVLIYMDSRLRGNDDLKTAC